MKSSTEFRLTAIPSEGDIAKHSKRFGGCDVLAARASLLLMRVGTDLAKQCDRQFSQNALSMGRFSVVMSIASSETRTIGPSEIARKLCVTKATMTGLVDGLERDGLVRRTGGKEDRRKQLISLTDKGRRLMETLLPDHYRVLAEFMSPLSKAKKREFILLLEQLLAANTGRNTKDHA